PAPATSLIYTLSLHDALPIFNDFPAYWVRFTDDTRLSDRRMLDKLRFYLEWAYALSRCIDDIIYSTLKPEISVLIVVSRISGYRSEEHTSELQSRENLVCRLL